MVTIETITIVHSILLKKQDITTQHILLE